MVRAQPPGTATPISLPQPRQSPTLQVGECQKVGAGLWICAGKGNSSRCTNGASVKRRGVIRGTLGAVSLADTVAAGVVCAACVDGRRALGREVGVKGFVWLPVLVLVGWSSLGMAQQLDQSITSPYFDCPYVNYFDSDCPQLREDERRGRERGRVRDRGEELDPGAEEEREGRGDGEGEDRLLPEEVGVLFPRESMAPDTPSLFRLLLENPTLENARRYVAWHARRTARVSLAQALIKQAGEEMRRGVAAAVEAGRRR